MFGLITWLIQSEFPVIKRKLASMIRVQSKVELCMKNILNKCEVIHWLFQLPWP